MNTSIRKARMWRKLSGPAAVVACGGLCLALALPLFNFSGTAQADVKVRPLTQPGAARSVNATPVADKGGTGSVSGTIVFEGTPAAAGVLVKKGDTAAKDAAVCAADNVPDESLVVNKSGSGIANVFVYLAKAPDGYKAAKPAESEVVFDQKGCRFLPHGLLVQVGQTVLVKSGDPIAHNTHTFPFRNTGFNQAIKPDDRVGVPLKYDKPERLPVEVKCDLHPWMRAYHLVMDHPFIAVTDENGKFEISGLPPGKHSFVVWQEKAGYLDRKYVVDVKADKTSAVKLSFGGTKFTSFQGPLPKTVTVSAVP